ncbi:hypothetical protein H1R20_g3576, partial [Candolleomyces eurysporus]
MPESISKNGGQGSRHATCLKAFEEDKPSAITHRSINSPIVVACAGKQAQTLELAIKKPLKIKVPSRKSREAKAQVSKLPSTRKAGPITSTVPGEPTTSEELADAELERKHQLNKDVACLCITNSKHIVYCRPCKIDIQLEQKSANYAGYYSHAWKKHTQSDRHQGKEEVWKAHGGHKVPKEQDQQWKAVWTWSGKRYRDGTRKMDYDLERVEVSTPVSRVPLAHAPDPTYGQVTSPGGVVTCGEVTTADVAVALRSDKSVWTADELMVAEELVKFSTHCGYHLSMAEHCNARGQMSDGGKASYIKL